MDSPPRLVDVMLDLASLDNQADLLELFAERALQMVDADQVTVLAGQPEDPVGGVVSAVAGIIGRPAKGESVPLEADVDDLAVEDLQNDSGTQAARLHDPRVCRAVQARLWAGRKAYGLVSAGYLASTDPPAADVTLLGDLAQVLTSQLDRLEAGESAEIEIAARERRTKRLTTLHGLESRLSRASTMHDVLGVLAASFFDLVPAERVSFARRGPEPGSSIVYAIQGVDRVSDGMVIPLDEDEFVETWTQHTYLYNPDHRLSSDNPVHQKLMDGGMLASLNLGVFVSGEPVGTLNVGFRDADPVTSEDRALLTTLASFMGSTLERIAAHDRLVYLAHHDALTGLIRREQFDDLLEAEIAQLRDRDATSAVCFIDLDRFKLVNDTDGHSVGDRLLRRVADTLRSATGPDDLVGRLGGDEFVVLLRHRSREEYGTVCGQLVDAVSQSGFASGQSMVSPSASAGWCLVDRSSPSAQLVLVEADAACYVAKSRGGGRAVLASESDVAQSQRRNAGRVVGLVREALDCYRLALLAQPIRRLSRSGADGCEVLVRLVDRDGSLLPPDSFIPVAERYGLIHEVDRWVCRTTLAELRRARERGGPSRPETVFVNVSANSIANDMFVDDVIQLLEEEPLEASTLCFEITESGTMRNMDATIDFIERVKDRAASVALDDFGVGLSSIGALQQLPIDHLKLDGSLIRQIDSNSISVATVTAVRTLTEALGVRTIAEHVESAAVLDKITSLGIDSAQGYYLGHPAPIERVLGIGPRTGSSESAVEQPH